MTDNSFVCGEHSFLSVIRDDSQWETSISPYHLAFLMCHAMALLTFIVSSATGNLSQVDKLWSILPALYAWMCVIDSRTRLMAILTTIWSVRLTYNFFRRGGYAWPPWQGDEDYRWKCLRLGVLGGWWRLLTKKWIMVVFNILFISLFQNYLLLYIASPSLVAWSMAMRGMHCPSVEGGEVIGVPPPLNFFDGIACFLFMAFFTVETLADNQQCEFQYRKKTWMSRLGAGGDFADAVRSISSYTHSSMKEYKDGFCQSGLFAIVRKPAYAGEQAIWISYYIFSVAASYHSYSELSPSNYFWNWSCGGVVSLCLLFQGSGWLTEQISVSKYPEYHSYQQNVPLYIPRISTVCHFLMGRRDSGDSKKNQ